MTNAQRKMAITLSQIWSIPGFSDYWTWQEIEGTKDINVWTKENRGRRKWTVGPRGGVKGCVSDDN